MPSPKFLRAMWSPQPPEGQVQMEQQCSFQIYVHIRAVLIFMLPSVSLIAFSFMAILAFLEFFVYRDTWMKYEYEVDKDFGR